MMSHFQHVCVLGLGRCSFNFAHSNTTVSIMLWGTVTLMSIMSLIDIIIIINNMNYDICYHRPKVTHWKCHTCKIKRLLNLPQFKLFIVLWQQTFFRNFSCKRWMMDFYFVAFSDWCDTRYPDLFNSCYNLF